MENPSHVISKNLKKIRNENGLSLDAVSKLTGVSKGMLGQIEREEVNPTITTILKIANGLKISFTSLLSEKEADVKTVELKKVRQFTTIVKNGDLIHYLLLKTADRLRYIMLKPILEW
ncbi:HTH-type transcriptional regulator SinR [Methanococcus maripaludis]|uniref:HTH-type transcriptional regulator SinR n=1 Tax=Methanococcus maripaludis TaxID=39152 RepID=A0A2L1CA65_METMI|nr:helix-turn-helix transcriptional regulator [Methanococcus maripaludis]AVB76262.1 HTH-type transcriptional regulator SinR [Methanococcus maripaludis]